MTALSSMKHWALAASLVFGMGAALFAPIAPAVAEQELSAEDAELWQSIRGEVFGADAKLTQAGDRVVLDAPYRALDAAIVPITVTIPADIAPQVEKLTLIVDKNPAPVVAQFTFGPAAGLGERQITTRIRIDMYSNVRAVIETRSGEHFITTRYVKAAGGCSAPALKDMDAALANIGKMKVKFREKEEATSKLTRQAQIMIRHPNYSGMQLNQVTGYYIPAKYVEYVEVRKGDELVFTMTGGISLSEDPNIRFTYAAGEPAPLKVEARDTDGKTFKITAERIGA
jgi:sulfur-oxidizing protein SoxY